MKENKFKWRPNLFDAAIIVLGVAAVCVLYFVMRPTTSAVDSGEAVEATVRYTVEVRTLNEGTHEYLRIGEEITDPVKNTCLGTLVSYTTHPSTSAVTNEKEGVIREVPVYGYEDIVLEIETDALIYDHMVTTPENFQLLVGSGIYLRTFYVNASGFIVTIELPEQGGN